MRYRLLGRTGLFVSELALGATELTLEKAQISLSWMKQAQCPLSSQAGWSASAARIG
ncbi:hypothetical protein [Pseudomonas sp. FP2300]|uniref:hypothetical protein n=1 Tax=Pseudomonas sp. FP2300 TaxID=2954090 RepID=UPI0027370902|nr:hypothetical protein [Pseudomonas sp. FP2300]WLH65209.1 hypothetical protein PSH86_11765 [Pseudomonas sp. FP2300]